jgi:RNA polymerase sigma factor (sigma-70 family)
MNDLPEFIAAVEKAKAGSGEVEARVAGGVPSIGDLPVHRFPGKSGQVGGLGSQNPHPVAENATRVVHSPLGHPLDALPGEGDGYGERLKMEPEEEQERRIYRGRTVGMLYTVVTFEDRVIFVHDMERCLEKLDGFAREVLGRIVLQEYQTEEAAKLLGCTRMTVHRTLLEALDQLSDILVKHDLLDPLSSNRRKSCQGGVGSQISVSNCEDGK